MFVIFVIILLAISFLLALRSLKKELNKDNSKFALKELKKEVAHYL